MPRKSIPSRAVLQAQRRVEKAADRQHREYIRHVERLRREETRKQEKLLRRVLVNVRGKGIYEPKGLELTKYRKKRARQVERDYGRYLDSQEYFFVKAPKARRKEIRERAEGLNIKSTPTGLFVEREGHTRATLKENRKNKELYIERSGRTKRGPRRGKRYTSSLPLASVDELDKERNRLREMARRMPLRNRDERLAFKIKENGDDGYSHNTFDSIEGLIRYLDTYKKSTAARINFFRHIELERVENSQTWNFEHPPRSKKERRARLRRSANSIQGKGRKRGD